LFFVFSREIAKHFRLYNGESQVVIDR